MKTLMLSTALAALMVAPAYAETATGTATSETATGETSMMPMYKQGDMQVSADTIMGQSVYMQREGTQPDADMDMTAGITDAPDTWESVGEVGDVMISRDGEVSSIVVDAGGLLGMGERNVNVSMSDLQFVSDSDTDGEFFVVYTGDRSSLEGSEEYNRDVMEGQGYNSLETWHQNSGVAQPNGMSEAGNDGAAESLADAPTDAGVVDPGADPMARPDRQAMMEADRNALTVETLRSARVYGANDEWVGEVSELMLAEDGKITHAVVDVGGWLGMGERPVALTMDELDIRQNDDGMAGGVTIYVDYTEEQLENMPEWNN